MERGKNIEKEIMENEIGKNMVSLREERNWTQKVLAEHSGVSERTLNRIENGEVTPQKETLQKIADTFGVPVTALTKKETEKKKLGYCPFRVVTKRHPDGYVTNKFSSCIGETCMAYQNGKCGMVTVDRK